MWEGGRKTKTDPLVSDQSTDSVTKKKRKKRPLTLTITKLYTKKEEPLHHMVYKWNDQGSRLYIFEQDFVYVIESFRPWQKKRPIEFWMLCTPYTKTNTQRTTKMKFKLRIDLILSYTHTHRHTKAEHQSLEWFFFLSTENQLSFSNGDWRKKNFSFSLPTLNVKRDFN